jgi:hypothetical protein
MALAHLFFIEKMAPGSYRKMFGKAPLQEPEPKPGRSPAKQALRNLVVLQNSKIDSSWWGKKSSWPYLYPYSYSYFYYYYYYYITIY